MQPGFVRLRAIQRLQARAAQGLPIDLAAVRGPSAVVMGTGSVGEGVAVARALRALTPDTRRRTVNGKAVEKYVKNPEVAAILFEWVQDDLCEPQLRRRAAESPNTDTPAFAGACFD